MSKSRASGKSGHTSGRAAGRESRPAKAAQSPAVAAKKSTQPAVPTGDTVVSAARSINSSGGAISISALRAKLTGTREQQDAAIKQAQYSNRITLYREDNTPALSKADRDAAYYTGGQPRHIVYVR